MPITLPLQKMTRADKLRAMEALWADLSKDEDKLPLPKWHREALAETEQAVQAGTATFSDWEDAKQRIIKRASQKSR